MDIKKTLDFLDQLCNQAMTEARQGNTALINRIGQNAAVAHYINNVVALRSLTREQWPLSFSQFAEEADRVRVEYEQAQAQQTHGDRLSALEQKLEQITQQLATFMEAQKPAPVAKPAPKKRAPVLEAEAPTESAVTDPEDQEPEESAAPVETPTEEDADETESAEQ